jgi:hypothetical protein
MNTSNGTRAVVGRASGLQDKTLAGADPILIALWATADNLLSSLLRSLPSIRSAAKSCILRGGPFSWRILGVLHSCGQLSGTPLVRLFLLPSGAPG